eukprot:TRINITY_DN1751_c0_g1_i1.p1 TRINITY_DN1751_c0_g1~~TRINITY_DN1751_c0_g1_i1.p1  ORF type:complete len:179 (-),score=108.76 TRINITY_DN1751_c0_g1_i1:77-613(-)
MMLARTARRAALSPSLNPLARFYSAQTVLDAPALIRTDGTAVESKDIFAGKKVVIFGVPGAFTPVCSNQHVPSFVNNAALLRSKGVDNIICVSVNDRFVMKKWQASIEGGENVEFLSDWNGEFVKKLGLDIDLSVAFLGTRSKRFSLLVDNGAIVQKNVEQKPSDMTVSGAEEILKSL